MQNAITTLLSDPAVAFFLRIMIFLLGATVGSFLNVVIYRVPLGLSVNDPKRSFCPICKKPIPYWRNIPVITWIMQRGKCAECGCKISPRYLLVEALVGILFLIIWEWKAFHQFPLVLPFWILLSLFVVTVFVDLEHFIIPDGVTIGGTVVGLVFCALVPMLHDQSVWWQGLLQGLMGAALGFGVLFAIVELGKKAFGSLKLHFDKPEPFTISQIDDEDEPGMVIDGETYLWSDLFFRKSDRLEIDAEWVSFDGGERVENTPLLAKETEFILGDKTVLLETLDRIEGAAMKVVVPREAMGFGDVKFMALVGAFLGWQGVLFTIFAGAILGTFVALPARLIGRQEWAAKIPFGPYLVAGATAWLFAGPQILDWYLGLGNPLGR